MTIEKRKEIVGLLNSDRISCIADYISVSQWSRRLLDDKFLKWYSANSRIVLLVEEDSKFLVHLYEIRQLLKELESSKFIVSVSIHEPREFWFIRKEEYDKSPQLDQLKIDAFLSKELQDCYEQMRHARYFGTDELSAFVNNEFQTKQELEAARINMELNEEKRKSRAAERSTRIVAWSSLIVSVVATIASIFGIMTYSTNREVLVKNLAPIPSEFRVQILNQEPLGVRIEGPIVKDSQKK